MKTRRRAPIFPCPVVDTIIILAVVHAEAVVCVGALVLVYEVHPHWVWLKIKPAGANCRFRSRFPLTDRASHFGIPAFWSHSPPFLLFGPCFHLPGFHFGTVFLEPQPPFPFLLLDGSVTAEP